MTTDGELQGLTVYDSEGNKIGNVGQVYLDDRTGRPEWVTVKTGLFGAKESFVPLESAQRQSDGLHIPYSKDMVKDAPRMEAGEHLDQPDEARLYSHYRLTTEAGTETGETTSGRGDTQITGMAGAAGPAGRAEPEPDTAAEERERMRREEEARTRTETRLRAEEQQRTEERLRAEEQQRTQERLRAEEQQRERMRASEQQATRTADTTELGMRGTSEEGQSMIRSEEQLRVGTEEHETGHARLRKYVVTEHVTTTVPISHEEVEVIREPISEQERANYATRSRPLGEGEVEITLHAEQPMVSKESVPVERVRLRTEKVTEQQEISADVQREQIEYENDSEQSGGMQGGGRRQ